MSATRASLLLRIKAHNDATAWNEFYKLYAPMLYRFVRARKLPHEDAEEVCSQCLEIVVRKIGDFEYDKKKGAFKNWLFRIADFKVIDLLRRHQLDPCRLGFNLATADLPWAARALGAPA